MAANDTGPLPLLSSFLSATEEEEEEEEGKEEEIPRGRFYEARSTAGKKRLFGVRRRWKKSNKKVF